MFHNHEKGVEKRLPDPSAPAVVLTISLLMGFFPGLFNLEYDAPWLPVALPVISVLATFHPSPLALGTAGFVGGIALENLQAFQSGDVPDFKGGELTVKGRVTAIRPDRFDRNTIMVKIREVLDTERKRTDFNLEIDVPAGERAARGDEVLVRVALRKLHTRLDKASTTSSALILKRVSDTRSRPRISRGLVRLRRELDSRESSPGCALLGAISLGERWRAGVRIRDVLRKTGTYHLLAISGIHVGAAILPVLILLRLGACTFQRIRPRASHALFLTLSLLALHIYAGFTGLSSSALRAALYFILAGSATFAVRNSLSVLNLCWCVLLIICFSAGKQPDISLVLSVLAVAGIILSFKGWSTRDRQNFVTGSLQMTLGAALFTLPVTVWFAGGISVVAFFGNLVAGMTFGLFLVPAAVLMDSASLFQWIPVGPLVSLWVQAAGLVFRFMAQIADLPISFLNLSLEGCLSASLAGAAGIMLWRRKGYRLGQGMAVFLAILVVSVSVQFITENIRRNKLVITFPRVGQADATLIRYDGLTVLVDCGPEGTPGGDSPAARTLQRLGIKHIDALFLSHLHPDHAGALEEIMTRWPVRVIYLSQDHVPDRQRMGHSRLTFVPPNVRILLQGEVVELSSMKFTLLGPDNVNRPGEDVNRRSQQLLLEMHDFKALFTGDAGWDQVLLSLSRIQSLDLLKLPHHGSKKNFPPAGFDKTVSRVAHNGELLAVCPSGPPGRRPLPTPEVVNWFEKRGIMLVYTGDNGINIIYKKGPGMGPGSTVVDKHDWF